MEQRIVDCLGVLRHPVEDGWSHRGVGDSVFAPNLPRKKCGDCEFELASRDDPQIIAYEAHGGQLSPPYVADHMSSLERVVRARAEDLAAIRSLDDWSVKVIFVSHTTAGQLPEQHAIATDIGALAVELEYLTFADVANELIAGGTPELFAHVLTAPLDSPYVHPRVRGRVLELAGPVN